MLVAWTFETLIAAEAVTSADFAVGIDVALASDGIACTRWVTVVVRVVIADAAGIFVGHAHPLAGAVLCANQSCRKPFVSLSVTVVIPSVADFDGGLIRGIGADQ